MRNELLKQVQHKMRKLLFIILLAIGLIGFSQQNQTDRIAKLKTKLEILSTDVNGLTEVFKTEIKANNLTISNLLLAVADVHKLNINPSQELNALNISPSFPDVIVSDLLLFLCKEYNLTIDFTGTIMSIKRYVKKPEEPEERIIPVVYNPSESKISIDAKNDNLYDVFKRITDESGKNLVFSPGLKDKPITAYIQNTPFKAAMENLAFANNLYVEQSKEGFYYFESGEDIVSNNPNDITNSQPRQRPTRRRNSNLFFEVKNPETQLLEVNFENTPIADIINDIGNELNIDVFTATPLEEAGSTNFKAKSIYFDDLLTKIFETQSVSSNSQNNTSQNPNLNANDLKSQNATKRFTFKKEGNIYFFGLEGQLSVREVAVIQMQHRSIELLSDPTGGQNRRSAGRNFGSGFNNSNFQENTGFNQQNLFNGNTRNRDNINTNRQGNFNSYSNQVEALVNIMPDEIKQNLDIKVDYELNSFYVNGPSADIERFRKFINKIDKPVPVILIEVMILEVSKTSSLEAGVTWGIGDQPVATQGDIFPETNLTLGAKTINRVIGGINGFGTFKVVPNFFATIKAMESNGDLKIRSTPKISTLNGHRATFSNGQTSYYTVTDQAIVSGNNSVVQTAVNFVPIDAELGLTIKPTVSGDGQVTLDIFVVQSNFGNRISEDAPPDINSREFSSIVRVKDQDLVVLGGLEEQSTNNSGSGVPFLARVPLIKWLFSKRVREGRKAKLTVLIKPTVIY